MRRKKKSIKDASSMGDGGPGSWCFFSEVQGRLGELKNRIEVVLRKAYSERASSSVLLDDIESNNYRKNQ